ncbi:MAG: hypothetical protein KC910_16870 [Candidatus Eremiobacteraeota bacterium]|nr:hypothetical protein [Candidatus Eremiobacteraeota bacterium]
MALHHQQSVARRAYTQAEAELRYREGEQFALREAIGKGAAPSTTVKAAMTSTTPEAADPIPPAYGQKLFERNPNEWTGLPDLRTIEAAPGHDYYEVTPKTSDSSLRVWGNRKYDLVLSQIPGYAAYAPNGSVELEQAFAWANPTFEDEGDTLESYSGIPLFVGAKNDIEVDNFPYGEAHSSAGEVTIEDGQAIGFNGPLPLEHYENDLFSQVQSARDTLEARTASGDKTNLIAGPEVTIGSILDLFFGDSEATLESLLGLHAATDFPLPMIPGFSATVPGVFFQFWFHVPYAPDGSGGYGSSSEFESLMASSEQAAKKLNDLKKAVDEAAVARDKAKKKYDQATGSAKDAALAELIEAENKLDDAKDDYDDQIDAIKDLQAQGESAVNAMMAAGSSPIPQTRAQDPSGTDGQFGWAYSPVMENMLGLLTDTLTGNFKNIANRLVARVRLVHFGDQDNVPFFDFGSTFTSRASWTVPRGRTLRFTKNMEIQGDLWLQRGSVMSVSGNLRVVAPPGVTPDTPFKPSGRVFLEEGATLIVRGNFECQGSSQFGSMMVGAEPGEVHPITSALMVDGDVTIPYGIYAGAPLDDLVSSLLEDFPAFQAMAHDILYPLISELAPNASKAAGPFHLRKPYFARFATTFQLTIIPPTIFNPPIPIPTPVPLPKKNILVPIAHALSYVYTTSLNLTLGENLYLQSDWWPFGQGGVPMAPKLDPVKAAAALSSVSFAPISLPDIDFETALANFKDQAIEGLVKYVTEEIIQELVEEVAAAVAPAEIGSVATAIDVVTDNLVDRDNKLVTAEDFLTGMLDDAFSADAKDALDHLTSNIDTIVENNYLREYSGLLVYSGHNINIHNTARLATGMFLAEGDINIGAERTVGTMLSRNGSVKARQLLYYPYFNRASLYLPMATSDNWLERGMELRYGDKLDSGEAVDVGPPPVSFRVSAAGWHQ